MAGCFRVRRAVGGGVHVQWFGGITPPNHQTPAAAHLRTVSLAPDQTALDQAALDYARAAVAIRYLRAEAPRQPTLAEVAAQVHLSPAHFQRLFTAWAGLSPKQFARTLTPEHAKQLLSGAAQPPSLFDVTGCVGPSSPSRLHDAFVRLEAVTPGESASGGAVVDIRYAFAKTRFGESLIASTPRSICSLSFGEDREAALRVLRKRYPRANLREDALSGQQTSALDLVNGGAADPTRPLAIHVQGSPFQVQVWRALLRIPHGEVATYGQIGKTLRRAGAAQAIGGAVGASRIAWLIPCHRVLRGDGHLSGYAWGNDRKSAMLGVEQAGAMRYLD